MLSDSIDEASYSNGLSNVGLRERGCGELEGHEEAKTNEFAEDLATTLTSGTLLSMI